MAVTIGAGASAQGHARGELDVDGIEGAVEVLAVVVGEEDVGIGGGAAQLGGLDGGGREGWRRGGLGADGREVIGVEVYDVRGGHLGRRWRRWERGGRGRAWRGPVTGGDEGEREAGIGSKLPGTALHRTAYSSRKGNSLGGVQQAGVVA